jgi:type III secretion protein S
MNATYLIQKALILSFMISGPLVLVIVVLGVVISLIQAVMQLQEQALPFGIKLLATVGVLAVLGHWMSAELLTFLREILQQLSTIESS